MKAAVRIKGMVKIPKDAAETLSRLRLRRKYACVVVRDSPEILGMLEKVRDYIAYGEIDKATLIELIKKRGQGVNNKEFNAEGAAVEFIDGKSLSELGLKPFFRLHPPRGGIKSKKHFPKGALGNHGDKIKKLIMRML